MNQLVLGNFINNKYSCIENFDNSDNNSNKQYVQYDTNNPSNSLILSQQNAGNIAYLKDRIDDIGNLSKTVQDLSGNYTTLQGQVNQLVLSQQQYTSQMTGGTPPKITGVISTDDSTNTNNGT